MADKLVVDLDDLQYTSTTLKTLLDQFENSKNIADGYRGFLGSGTLSDAIGDFAGDWDYHKKKIVESMKNVQKMAETSHDTFLGSDQKLAQGLTSGAHSQAHQVRVAQ